MRSAVPNWRARNAGHVSKQTAARAQSERTTRSCLDVDPLAAVARSVPAFDGKFRHAVPVEKSARTSSGILQPYANAYSIEPSFVCSQTVQVAMCGAGLFARSKFWRRCGMDEKITSKMLSRRKALSVLVAAFGLAVPTVAVTGSDAEAQTVGMQRRHERRTGRHERRTDRRTGRTERREDRRTGGTQQ